MKCEKCRTEFSCRDWIPSESGFLLFSLFARDSAVESRPWRWKVVKIQPKHPVAHDRTFLSILASSPERDVSNPESPYYLTERAKLSKRAVIERCQALSSLIFGNFRRSGRRISSYQFARRLLERPTSSREILQISLKSHDKRLRESNVTLRS